MAVGSRLKSLFVGEQETPTTTIEQKQTENPMQTTQQEEKPRGKFGEWLGNFVDLFNMGSDYSAGDIYKNAYKQDKETVEKVLGNRFNDFEVTSSTWNFWDNPLKGVGGMVSRLLPNDFKHKMDKAEDLYTEVGEQFSLYKNNILTIEEAHKKKQIDDQTYRDAIYQQASEALSIYNEAAKRRGLGELKGFNELEKSMFLLNDVYSTKSMYDKERSVLAEKVLRVIEPKYSESIQSQADAMASDYANDLLSKMSGISNQDYTKRFWDGKPLSNSAVFDATKKIVGDFNNEYNTILSTRKTIMRAQEETPGSDFSPELEAIDRLLVKAKEDHGLFLDTYVKNIGKEGYQNIQDFTSSYEKDTGKNVKDMFSDAKLGFFRVSDVREAQIIKDYALLKRDLGQTLGGNLFGLGSVAPFRVIDGKLKMRAPTVLTAGSLLRGSLVTPTVKNTAGLINNVINLGSTTDFYNSGMNMLKSSAFNLDESKDYKVVDFMRGAANFAPDAVEFLVPISKVASVQQLLWKGTVSASKVARYSDDLAKAAVSGVNSIKKTGKMLELLEKTKPSAWTQFTKGMINTAIDINLINIPFETRNPNEYSAVDALFDISFNAFEVMYRLRRTTGPLSAEINYNQIKNSDVFLDSVFKEVAYQKMTPDAAKEAWGIISNNPEQLLEARMVAKNLVDYGEKFKSFSFLLGVDPDKYASLQRSMKNMNTEAYDLLLSKTKREAVDTGFKRGFLTEAEMSDIVERNIKTLQDPDLLDERRKFRAEVETKDLNTVRYKPDEEILEGSKFYKAVRKIDASDYKIQEEGFQEFKKLIDDITKKLDAGTGDKDSLIKERAFYVNWLDYYQKTKWELDRFISESSEDAIKEGASGLLGAGGYLPELNIKHINEKKSYIKKDQKAIDDLLFVDLDNEKIHKVSAQRWEYHDLYAKDPKTGKSIRRTEPRISEFYILRSKGKQKIYHIQNFEKLDSNFISQRLFPDSSEGRVQAMTYIKRMEGFETPNQHITNNRGILVSDDQLIAIKREIKPLDPLKAYSEREQSIGARNAVGHINDMLSDWKTNRRGDRVLSVFADMEPDDWAMFFKTKGDLPITRIDDISKDITELVIKYPGNNLFSQSIKDVDNPKLLKNLESFYNKYRIVEPKEQLTDLFERADYVSEFIEYNEIFKGIAPAQKAGSIQDANILNAKQNLDAIDSVYNPREVGGSKEDVNVALKKENNELSIAESQGQTELASIKKANIDTYQTIKYDYEDLGSIDVKGKGMFAAGNKFVNNYIKAIFPQGRDFLSNQFQKGMLEFIRLNNSHYFVDGKQLKEVIPKKGTDAYKQLVNDIDSGMRKDSINKIMGDAQTATTLTDAEANAVKLWKTAERYFNDMAFVCGETFGDFKAKPIRNVNRGLDFIRQSNEYNSIFYFVSGTDKDLYKLMTDPNRMDEYFARFGEPTTITGSKRAKIGKINDIIIDMARQGKGNPIIRALSQGIGPDWARRSFNFFTGGAYIIGTTVINPALLPSQLFINGIGLTTDAMYRSTWTSLGGDGVNKFWKHSDIDGLMKKYGILFDGDDFDILPRTTNIGGLRKQYSNNKYIKQMNKFFNNTVNAGLYNFTEMAFDKSFKMQRVVETLVADWGIRNLDEFDAYVRRMPLKEQGEFVGKVNEAAARRYTYKTGNQFSELDKFYFGNSLTPAGIATKTFMRSISLLANWGYTHVKSISSLLTGYNLNKIALANFESGKGSLLDSKKVVQNLLNYNYDYEMLMNKIFFTLSVGRKLDRISNNDIEEDTNILDSVNDITGFAKYLYAPLAGFESNPLYRIITQTIGTAITAGTTDELDLNAAQAAGTTLLTRVMAEMRRRTSFVGAIVKGTTTTIVDPNVSWAEGLPQIYKAWKEGTAGFGYFIDRDINYYGYEPDMPYTPNSELSLYIPEWNKWKTEFVRMNTLKQMAELQKTDKSAWDYFRYRLPIRKEFEIGKFGDTTGYQGGLRSLVEFFGKNVSNDLSVDHYVVNTPKWWNELQHGDLKLNGDLEAGEYVFSLLTKHSIQGFSDAKQMEGTKVFLETMAKEYNLIGDNGELIRLGGMSNKESLWVKNMFKLAQEGRMATFFTEFTKADNNKQKQGLLLMSYIDAQISGSRDNVPGVGASLVSSIAQDMYYQLSNKVKKDKGIPFEPGKFLSDYDPIADQEIKYFIADQLGESLYFVDKTAWSTLGRYYARDRAIKSNDPIVNLFKNKYNDEGRLAYGDVNIVRSLKDKKGKDRTNFVGNSFNDLYLLSNILIAEGKTNPDKFYVGLASIVSPKNNFSLNDPASVNIAMSMTKLIAERIDDSVLPQQEKTANKMGLLAALLPVLNSVGPDVIETIGEDKFRQLQDWVFGTFKEMGEQEINLSYKLAQDGQYKGVSTPTGTILDQYNANGNYKNTYWGSDPAKTYAKSQRYYDPIARYYRNNYAKIPNVKIKTGTTFGKDAYSKNLYLKLIDANTQSVSGGIGKGEGITTGFKLKGGKPIKLQQTKKFPSKGGLIDSAKDSGLIRGSTTRRSVKYEPIRTTYIETKGGQY